jgi:hypothetical protein
MVGEVLLACKVVWNKSEFHGANQRQIRQHTVAAHCGSTLRTAKLKTRYNQISVLVWKTVTIYNRGRTGYAHRFRNLKCSTPATNCFLSSIGQTLRIQTACYLLPQKKNMNKPLTVGQTQGQPSIKGIPSLVRISNWSFEGRQHSENHATYECLQGSCLPIAFSRLARALAGIAPGCGGCLGSHRAPAHAAPAEVAKGLTASPTRFIYVHYFCCCCCCSY